MRRFSGNLPNNFSTVPCGCEKEVSFYKAYIQLNDVTRGCIQDLKDAIQCIKMQENIDGGNHMDTKRVNDNDGNKTMETLLYP